MRVIDRLYRELKKPVGEIWSELLRLKLVEAAATQSMHDSFQISTPYNVSVLRYLAYHDTQEQAGAKEHFDKSWLSIHLGESAGELYILDNAGDWKPVSPPKGMAVVFFGVKVLALSNGKLRPTRHRATVEPGVGRNAMVLFAHADIGTPVADAQEAYDAFFRNNGSFS